MIKTSGRSPPRQILYPDWDGIEGSGVEVGLDVAVDDLAGGGVVSSVHEAGKGTPDGTFVEVEIHHWRISANVAKAMSA
jgi:hypothetical protein